MADKIPLKGLFDGSGNVTGLAEFRSADGDTIGVSLGGTGLATVGTNRILTGNGTGDLTDEANLTFDGTTLTVTGNIVATGNFEAQTQITTVDPVLLIDSGRSGNPASTDDAGIIIERGSDTNVSIFWDESEQHFSFATTTDTGAGNDNTIAVSAQTDIKAGNITSTGNLAISGTLTGVTSLTMNGALSGITNLGLSGNLQFDSGQVIDGILVDATGSTKAFTTSVASETKLVTEKAVKTHVSAQASAFAIALG
tara:strand:+ start:3280 stop:4041 length:762 start_codon:yes stop_codon:yes gene_type:complete